MDNPLGVNVGTPGRVTQHLKSERNVLALSYAAVCSSCGGALDARSEAWWDAELKQASCLKHVEQPGLTEPDAPVEATVAPGVAGASALREFERRSAKREERIRSAHPHLGGLILALTSDPQSTRAWATGAEGERRLGELLDGATMEGAVVLPLAASSSSTRSGTRARSNERLYVGRRDCSKLIDGMHRQLGVVRDVLGPDAETANLSGVLCFVGAEWGLFSKPFELNGVIVTWPKALVERFRGPQVLQADAISGLASRLGSVLPPS